MLGISYLGKAGASASSPLSAAPVTAGLPGLALFGRHIRRVPDPFIAGRGFGAVNVINILYGGVVAGLLALVPLYAAGRYRISALGSGTLLTAEGIAVIAQPALPGQLQAKVFAAFAVLLVACLPVIARVPEHRGSW